jgi:nitrous oxide reductase accessory protein NosL
MPPKKKHHHKVVKIKPLFQTVPESKATLVQSGKNRLHCVVCGMNLVKYYKTSHTAKVDENEEQYCSLHCLAAQLNEGEELRNPKVVDVTTLKLIPVQNAYYVVGSDVKGTMTQVSKYAFASLNDAEAFQAKHGGRVVDFNEALRLAKQDFN